MSALDTRDLDGLASRLARVEASLRRIELRDQREYVLRLVAEAQQGIDHNDPALTPEQAMGFVRGLRAVLAQAGLE